MLIGEFSLLSQWLQNRLQKRRGKYFSQIFITLFTCYWLRRTLNSFTHVDFNELCSDMSCERCTYVYFVPTCSYSALNMASPRSCILPTWKTQSIQMCDGNCHIWRWMCRMKMSQCSGAEVETDRYVQIHNWTGKWMKKACHILLRTLSYLYG